MNLPKRIRGYFQDISESMNSSHGEQKEYQELAKISAFIRCGLFVMSVILISGIAVAYGQNKLKKTSVSTGTTNLSQTETSQTYTKSEKKLPIYCVNTDEKKVALSFDAAWGISRMLESVYLFSNNHQTSPATHQIQYTSAPNQDPDQSNPCCSTQQEYQPDEISGHLFQYESSVC